MRKGNRADSRDNFSYFSMVTYGLIKMVLMRNHSKCLLWKIREIKL